MNYTPITFDDSMPQQIDDPEKFLDLAAQALNCRVKRTEKNVKLKLKTRKRLYTLITDPETADVLIKKLSCEIIEI
ncbi:MAG: hypothetical protein ACFFCS_01975 [Candidatus Hodarchaeota archaeon]